MIRGGFLEIPGLRLTEEQVRRLWGLHADTCTTVLDALVHERFLRVTLDGRYVQAGSCGAPRHPASPIESFRHEMAVGWR
jgi:hypothetical protein